MRKSGGFLRFKGATPVKWQSSGENAQNKAGRIGAIDEMTKLKKIAKKFKKPVDKREER